MCQSAHAVGEILKDCSKSSGFPVDCHILIQWYEMLIIFYIFLFGRSKCSGFLSRHCLTHYLVLATWKDFKYKINGGKRCAMY